MRVIASAGGRRGDAVAQFIPTPIDPGVGHVFFARKVVEKGPPGHICGRSDLVDRRRVVALTDEQLHGGVDDPLACLLAAPGSAAIRSYRRHSF